MSAWLETRTRKGDETRLEIVTDPTEIGSETKIETKQEIETGTAIEIECENARGNGNASETVRITAIATTTRIVAEMRLTETDIIAVTQIGIIEVRSVDVTSRGVSDLQPLFRTLNGVHIHKV
jgi:hypothetical protein